MRKFKSFVIVWSILFLLFNAAVFSLPLLLGEDPFFRQASLQDAFEAWCGYILFIVAFICQLLAYFVIASNVEDKGLEFWCNLPICPICYAFLGGTLGIGILYMTTHLSEWTEIALQFLVMGMTVAPIIRAVPYVGEAEDDDTLEQAPPTYKLYDLSDDDWFRQFMQDYLKDTKTHTEVLEQLEQEDGKLPEDLEQRCIDLLLAEDKES